MNTTHRERAPGPSSSTPLRDREASIDELLGASNPASDAPPWTLGVEHGSPWAFEARKEAAPEGERAARQRVLLAEAAELLNGATEFDRALDHRAAVTWARASAHMLVGIGPAAEELRAEVALASERFEANAAEWHRANVARSHAYRAHEEAAAGVHASAKRL